MKSKVLEGLSWSAIGQIFNTGIVLIVSIILARLLSPFEFGVMAMAMGAHAMVTVLADVGFTALIIKVHTISMAELNGIFIARLLIGLLQIITTYFFAPLIAWFFDSPELVPVLRSLMLIFLFSSFGMIPDALLQKSIDFKRLSYISVIGSVVSGGVGVGLALEGFGIWSLVTQYLLSAAINAMLLFFYSPWRPSISVSYGALISNKNYIFNTYGLNIVGAFVQQCDRLILGKLLGASALGLYMRGMGLAQQIQGFIMSVAGQVGFPALAAISNDKNRVKSGFLKIIGAVAGIVIPVLLLTAALSTPIIYTLFGEKWLLSAPVFRLIAIGLMLNSINITWDWLMRALGHVDILFRWALLDGSLRIAAVGFGAMINGIVGAASGFAVISLPLLLLRARWMGRVSGIAMNDFFRPLGLPLLLGFLSSLAGLAATWPFQQEYMQLIAGMFAAVVVYLAGSRMFGNPLLASIGFFRKA